MRGWQPQQWFRWEHHTGTLGGSSHDEYDLYAFVSPLWPRFHGMDMLSRVCCSITEFERQYPSIRVWLISDPPNIHFNSKPEQKFDRRKLCCDCNTVSSNERQWREGFQNTGILMTRNMCWASWIRHLITSWWKRYVRWIQFDKMDQWCSWC